VGESRQGVTKVPDEGALEPGKFYADYPLWTLYDEALDKKLGMPGGVPRINPPGKPPLLAIFTDADLARRFIEDLRRPDVQPLALPNPKAVLVIAEHFQKEGVQYVGIDISFHPPGMQIHPIGEFIEDVRRGDV
jgi:hypothetical protein